MSTKLGSLLSEQLNPYTLANAEFNKWFDEDYPEDTFAPDEDDYDDFKKAMRNAYLKGAKVS